MVWSRFKKLLSLGLSNSVFVLIVYLLLNDVGLPLPVLAQTSGTPVIGVSPSSLSFTAVPGGPNPATQYISVSNTGGGTLSWSSVDSSGWMTANGSGTNSGTIPVTVYSNGTPAGTYSATVTITAPGAASKTVPITVVITSSGSNPPPPTSTTPVIGTNPSSLSFTAVAGGANPGAQYITVSNTGGGTLSWSSTDSSGWITANASGTNSGTIPVNVFSNGVAAGTYSSTVTISAAGATTKTVPITITITSSSTPPSTTPTLTVSPTSLTFTAVPGGANPPTQYISVSNAGGGTLSWSSVDSSGWMTANGSGTNSGTIPVNVFSNGTPAGTYSATVTVTATGYPSQTKTVPITVNITTGSGGSTSPTIGFNPTSLSFAGTVGGTNPAGKAISISNTGGGTLSWSASENASWLSMSPSTGTNAGTTTAFANLSGLATGTYNGTITISASGATTKAIPVSFTVSAANAKSATLTWSANAETDLAGYRIYRATSSGGYGAPVASLSKASTSYVAGSLLTGTTYYFVITAYDSSGNESSYSNEVSKSVF